MFDLNINVCLKECENDPEAKKGNNADMLAKCRAGLVDYQVVIMLCHCYHHDKHDNYNHRKVPRWSC